MLKDEIIRIISDMKPQLGLNIIEIINKRVDVYRVARGGHWADNIFRT